MELTEALRTTGAVREFTDQAVDDVVLARVLDTARFAPSGSNAQAWRVVVVKDTANRCQLRDSYLRGSRDYLALAAAGLRPCSPTCRCWRRSTATPTGTRSPAARPSTRSRGASCCQPVTKVWAASSRRSRAARS